MMAPAVSEAKHANVMAIDRLTRAVIRISYTDYPSYTRYFPSATYNRRLVMDQGGACAASVCVIRTKRAWTGANEITVRGPLPFPSATGALHVVPLVDT